jgi:hypothetical protein
MQGIRAKKGARVGPLSVAWLVGAHGIPAASAMVATNAMADTKMAAIVTMVPTASQKALIGLEFRSPCSGGR